MIAGAAFSLGHLPSRLRRRVEDDARSLSIENPSGCFHWPTYRSSSVSASCQCLRFRDAVQLLLCLKRERERERERDLTSLNAAREAHRIFYAIGCCHACYGRRWSRRRIERTKFLSFFFFLGLSFGSITGMPARVLRVRG